MASTPSTLNRYPEAATTNYTITFRNSANTSNINIKPATEDIGNTWTAIEGGGGGGNQMGGLTTTQVRALIATWAQAGNAGLIPIAKLPNLNTRIDPRIVSWAREGNTGLIPTSKLPPLGLVQADVDARVQAGVS